MDAQKILNKCREIINREIGDVKHYKATVKDITEDGIFLQYAWSNTVSTIPTRKLKGVTLQVNDVVLIDKVGNSYIIMGVIE